MKKPSARALKSIFCFALLALPAAHGAPRKAIGTAPPKARVVAFHPTKTKIPVGTSSGKGIPKARIVHEATPKVVEVRPDPPSNWFLTPKFRKTGKDDTTWGLVVNRRF